MSAPVTSKHQQSYRDRSLFFVRAIYHLTHWFLRFFYVGKPCDVIMLIRGSSSQPRIGFSIQVSRTWGIFLDVPSTITHLPKSVRSAHARLHSEICLKWQWREVHIHMNPRRVIVLLIKINNPRPKLTRHNFSFLHHIPPVSKVS